MIAGARMGDHCPGWGRKGRTEPIRKKEGQFVGKRD